MAAQISNAQPLGARTASTSGSRRQQRRARGPRLGAARLARCDGVPLHDFRETNRRERPHYQGRRGIPPCTRRPNWPRRAARRRARASAADLRRGLRHALRVRVAQRAQPGRAVRRGRRRRPGGVRRRPPQAVGVRGPLVDAHVARGDRPARRRRSRAQARQRARRRRAARERQPERGARPGRGARRQGRRARARPAAGRACPRRSARSSSFTRSSR